jgi:hypothetical protein
LTGHQGAGFVSDGQIEVLFPDGQIEVFVGFAHAT